MKVVIVTICSIAALIGLVAILSLSTAKSDVPTDGNNVVAEGGKQIVTVAAKGGYFPRSTTAKANTPTTLKVVTKGTFDCSSALVIPSLGYRTMLPQSGETLIDIPPQKAGSTLQGLCAMGMYSFEIKFS